MAIVGLLTYRMNWLIRTLAVLTILELKVTKAKQSKSNIILVKYPSVQRSALYGLQELLETAQAHSSQGVRFQVHILSTQELYEFRENCQFLILPPSLEQSYAYMPQNVLRDHLQQRHADGTILVSVCAGAFLLAQTNLLNNIEATTHWGLAEKFKSFFPEVNLNPEKMIVDCGDIITAGGLMSWVDLGLHLIQKLMGKEVTRTVAKLFLVDPTGREQRFYNPFSPVLGHGDSQILKVQHWVHKNFHQKISLKTLSKIAALGERTFIRRFQKSTGNKPTEYVQNVRIQKACERIETTQDNIDTIAWDIGYEDIASFRKVFKNRIGLTPGEYRKRFYIE